MIEKFDKYWSQTNGILVIATILDRGTRWMVLIAILGEYTMKLERNRGILGDLLTEY